LGCFWGVVKFGVYGRVFELSFLVSFELALLCFTLPFGVLFLFVRPTRGCGYRAHLELSWLVASLSSCSPPGQGLRDELIPFAAPPPPPPHFFFFFPLSLYNFESDDLEPSESSVLYVVPPSSGALSQSSSVMDLPVPRSL